MSFDTKLLSELLVCTKCRGTLLRDGQRLVCAGPSCRLTFEIRDDIPNMLLEDAAPLGEDDWSSVMQREGRDPRSGALVVTG